LARENSSHQRRKSKTRIQNNKNLEKFEQHQKKKMSLRWRGNSFLILQQQAFSTASAPPSRNNNNNNNSNKNDSKSNTRPPVYVSGPMQSRINVADSTLSENATRAERKSYYTSKIGWTAVGASFVAIGASALFLLFFGDVEFLQPRHGSLPIMRKALMAMNSHAAFLKIIGRLPSDPTELARITLPSNGNSLPSASALVSRYRHTDNRVFFQFKIDAPNGLVLAAVEARLNSTTGEYDLFSLVCDIPKFKKRVVIVRDFQTTSGKKQQHH
jgi:hypothetical protein